MHHARRVNVRLPLSVRVCRILDDYKFWISHPVELKAALQRLRKPYGQAVLDRWFDLIDSERQGAALADLKHCVCANNNLDPPSLTYHYLSSRWETFVGDILVTHYDPQYTTSGGRKSEPFSQIDLVDFSDPEVEKFLQEAAALSSKVAALGRFRAPEDPHNDTRQ